MRFVTYQPRGRFRTTKADPYQFDLPVIGGGVMIVLVGIILVAFVFPLLLQQWHELPDMDVVKHEYPAEALEQRLEGEVVIQYRVDGRGTVSDPVIIEADPPGVFDDAAMLAVSRYRYEPIRYFGKASSALITQKLRFRPPDPESGSIKWGDKYPTFPEQIVYGYCDTPPVLQIRIEPRIVEDTQEHEGMWSHIEFIGVQNECLVTFWVNDDGKVSFPAVERGFRSRLSRPQHNAIITAVSRWEYQPATRNGVSVSRLVPCNT